MEAAGSRLPAHPFFAITEFNSWWLPETKDPDYRLANALYFGGVFNVLLRHSKHIFLAEPCSLINVQGIIEVNPLTIKLTPPYFAYLLYANHIGSEVLKTEATGPSEAFDSKPPAAVRHESWFPSVAFDSKLPALDAIATRGPEGRTIFLAVVNRAQDQAISTQINLKGWQLAGAQAQVYELDGKSWDAFNPYGSTKNVSITHRTVAVGRMPLSYVFPAHTITVLEVSGHLLGAKQD
jgi:alpha-N-arabinofuranosidase